MRKKSYLLVKVDKQELDRAKNNHKRWYKFLGLRFGLDQYVDSAISEKNIEVEARLDPPDPRASSTPALAADPEAVRKLVALWDRFFPSTVDLSRIRKLPENWTNDEFLASFKLLAKKVLGLNDPIDSDDEARRLAESMAEDRARQVELRRRELLELVGKMAAGTLTGGPPGSWRELEVGTDKLVSIAGALLDAVDGAVTATRDTDVRFCAWWMENGPEYGPFLDDKAYKVAEAAWNNRGELEGGRK